MIRIRSALGGNKGGDGKDETGRPDFASEDPRGRGAAVFGLALTAAILYLKSFLPMAHAEEAMAEAGEGDAPDAAPARSTAAEGPGGGVGQGDPDPATAREAEQDGPPAVAGVLRLPDAALSSVGWAGAPVVPMPVRDFAAGAVAANNPAPPMPGRAPWRPQAEEPVIRFPGQGDFGAEAGEVLEASLDEAETDDGTSATDAADPADDDPYASGPPPAPNRPPRNSGPVYLSDFAIGTSVFISLTMLLANTADADADTLSVTDLRVSRGTLQPAADGWTFTPDDGDPGPVEFSYTVSDGAAGVDQVAHARIVPQEDAAAEAEAPLIVATPDGDDVEGGPEGENVAAVAGDDQVDGGAGDDIILGGDGDDHLSGGGGNDIILGGGGNDEISGGEGEDRVLGEAGDDRLDGDGGNDSLDGGEGDDTLDGGQGHDVLAGGSGEDLLGGGDGNDTLEGGAGDDALAGDAGADVIAGGDGNDTLRDGAGADTVDGGAGDDRVLAAADCADDVFTGGEGLDLLDYAEDTAGVIFDLAENIARGAEIGTDAFVGFEALAGGAGDDLFLIAGAGGLLTGGAGDDCYVFEEERLPLESGLLRFQITDFAVGDRIDVGSINLFKRGCEERPDEEDVMKDVYDALKEYDFGEMRPKIRLREERNDTAERTLIEVDFDRDATYELTITLDGLHLVASVDLG